MHDGVGVDPLPLRKPPGGGPDSSRSLRLFLIAYAAITAVAIGIGFARGRPNLLVCPAALTWPSRGAAHLASLVGGVAFAALVVGGTRTLVRRSAWAAALHEDLRPFARALAPEAIPLVALASSIGEEALFRGALVPLVGVVASSVLFGALHQVRGRSRLPWWAFATVVGLVLGALLRATGSLLGPLVAHAAINGLNLRFLVTHDPQRTPRLGGLLGRR